MKTPRFVVALSAATALLGATGDAAMAGPEPYVGEITMIGGNFCPEGWVDADGRLLPISQFTTLYSLLGTMYGGDGRTTFGVPDLRSRIPLGIGTGPGLMTVTQGQEGGRETVVLDQGHLPMHTHSATSEANSALNATTQRTDTNSPNGSRLGELPNAAGYAAAGAFDAALEAGSVTTTVTTTIGSAGGGQPFSVLQPYIGIRFCIASQGIYPPRP
ncbi:MAG: phage tail protein [Paracoccaceae bacterium]|jgi:microcystin-dependent protein